MHRNAGWCTRQRERERATLTSCHEVTSFVLNSSLRQERNGFQGNDSGRRPCTIRRPGAGTQSGASRDVDDVAVLVSPPWPACSRIFPASDLCSVLDSGLQIQLIDSTLTSAQLSVSRRDHDDIVSCLVHVLVGTLEAEWHSILHDARLCVAVANPAKDVVFLLPKHPAISIAMASRSENFNAFEPALPSSAQTPHQCLRRRSSVKSCQIFKYAKRRKKSREVWGFHAVVSCIRLRTAVLSPRTD